MSAIHFGGRTSKILVRDLLIGMCAQPSARPCSLRISLWILGASGFPSGLSLSLSPTPFVGLTTNPEAQFRCIRPGTVCVGIPGMLCVCPFAVSCLLWY